MKRARTWLLGAGTKARQTLLGFAPDAGEIAGGLLVAYGLGLIYLPLGIIAAGLGLIAYVHGGADNAETS